MLHIGEEKMFRIYAVMLRAQTIAGSASRCSKSVHAAALTLSVPTHTVGY